MFAPKKLVAAACAVSLGTIAVTQAAEAVGAQGQSNRARHTVSAHARSDLSILHRPSARFHGAIAGWRRHHPTGSAGGAGGFPPPESFGVSSSTLDVIAACESGGDPIRHATPR